MGREGPHLGAGRQVLRGITFLNKPSLQLGSPVDTRAFVNCFSNLALIECLLCARPSDKPDSGLRDTQPDEEDTCESVMTAQCVSVTCLLDGRARFDAGTNQAAPGGSDIEAKMKAEEEFLRGESLGVEFQRGENSM